MNKQHILGFFDALVRMPAFLFLSGMFARFDRGKFIFGMALPYLVL